MNRTSLSVVCDSVCEHFKINPWDMFYKSRERGVVWPRQLFQYLASKWTSNTLNRIGSYGYDTYRSGNYDHATVMHSKRAINNLMDISDRETLEVITSIEEIIKKSIYKDYNFIPVEIHLLSKCEKYTESFI